MKHLISILSVLLTGASTFVPELQSPVATTSPPTPIRLDNITSYHEAGTNIANRRMKDNKP